MATNAANVQVAVTGAVSVGDGTATAPTDAATALATGWTDLGYLSEEGVTEARSRDLNEIRGWQNGDTVRQVVTGATMTYRCVFLESKREVIETYYGGTVDTNGSIVIAPGKLAPRVPMNFDYDDPEIGAVRAYAPAAQVTEVGDQVWSNGEPIGYDVTVTCYPDSSITTDDGQPGSVQKFYEHLDTTP